MQRHLSAESCVALELLVQSWNVIVLYILRVLSLKKFHSDTRVMSLHLLITGAGLAGLSAAISTKLANPHHRVTILESVKELAEVGVCSIFWKGLSHT